MKSKWFDYPKKKPKTSGRYLCKLDDGLVTLLYYNRTTNTWVDPCGFFIFREYYVYEEITTDDGKKVLSEVDASTVVEFNNVTGWRILPK